MYNKNPLCLSILSCESTFFLKQIWRISCLFTFVMLLILLNSKITLNGFMRSLHFCFGPLSLVVYFDTEITDTQSNGLSLSSHLQKISFLSGSHFKFISYTLWAHFSSILRTVQWPATILPFKICVEKNGLTFLDKQIKVNLLKP